MINYLLGVATCVLIALVVTVVTGIRYKRSRDEWHRTHVLRDWQ